MYKQLIILRKDILREHTGKALAMACHCSMAFLTNYIRATSICSDNEYKCNLTFDKELYEQWIDGAFTKTICEAKNKNYLLKAEQYAQEAGLVKNKDYWLIRDNCLTVLTPEDEDGRTLVGIGFRPLPEEVVHKISKKYHLYV